MRAEMLEDHRGDGRGREEVFKSLRVLRLESFFGRFCYLFIRIAREVNEQLEHVVRRHRKHTAGSRDPGDARRGSFDDGSYGRITGQYFSGHSEIGGETGGRTSVRLAYFTTKTRGL